MKKPGRNDPCPCGSGKKYKQCCQPHAGHVTAGGGASGRSVSDAITVALGYYQVGQLLQAEVICRQILAAFPDHPDGLHLSGMIASQTGKHQAAVELIGKAISIKPSCTMYYNLGSALMDQGKLDAAIESYQRALVLKPDFAEAYCNLGLALDGLCKHGAAIECYRRALALKPDFAEAYSYLANAFNEMGCYEDAIENYRKLIEIKPDFADAHINVAGVLRGRGRLDEATESINRVLAFRPDSAAAHNMLATIHLDLGEFEAAREALSRALKFDPDHLGAWASLAQLRKMTPEDSTWLDTALRLLTKPILPVEPTISLRFAIGKYYDDTAQYDLAFPAYIEANALRRKANGIEFDRAEFSRFIDTLVAAYTDDFVHQEQEGASQSQRPVLVVGMPRSGTSLTEQIIASHPAAFGAGELTFWGSQANKHPGAMLSGNADAELVARITGEYEQLLQRCSAEATRVVDKMPGNFLYLGFIHALFPRARIIHTRRNPIDTCLSIFFQNFSNQHKYATDIEDLAFYYREYDRLMRHWRAVLPADRFLEVPYESLIEDSPGWSRRIIEFIGLDWDDRCLDFHETKRKVGTESNWQVRQKIYKTSKERWRNYEKFVEPLLPLLELADGK